MALVSCFTLSVHQILPHQFCLQVPIKSILSELGVSRSNAFLEVLAMAMHS